jgi:hypothetical protein
MTDDNLMGKMTIKDAKYAFEKWGDSLQKPLDELIDNRCKCKPGEAISNDNYFMALCFTNRMFEATQKNIRMLAGNDGNDFIGLLSVNFLKAMERIKQNKGFAHIILITEKIPEFLKSLKTKYGQYLDFKQARLLPGQNIKHFIVCDENIVREEEIHEPLTENMSADTIKASVYFNNLAKGGIKASEFDGIWEALSTKS